MELKNLPFRVDAINVMKLLVLREEDNGLNCEQNFNYFMYCNIVINNLSLRSQKSPVSLHSI